jgi:hypothetical protein
LNFTLVIVFFAGLGRVFGLVYVLHGRILSVSISSYELRFECSYTLWKAGEIIYNFVNSEIVHKNLYPGVICIGTESVCDPEIVEQSVFRGQYL